LRLDFLVFFYESLSYRDLTATPEHTRDKIGITENTLTSPRHGPRID
jgi:hypothetical protein